MTKFLVTADHPITLEGGRPVEPGGEVNAKASDPYIADLIQNGKLVEPPKAGDGPSADELKAALKEKGITFPAKASKADLATLLEEANTSAGDNNDQAEAPEQEESK